MAVQHVTLLSEHPEDDRMRSLVRKLVARSVAPLRAWQSLVACVGAWLPPDRS